MKTLQIILFGLMFLSTTVVFSAETIILSAKDLRQSPTAAPLLHRTNTNTRDTKKVEFTFDTGDLWVENPTATLWVMTDGYVDSSLPKDSLQGRGVLIGNTNGCFGIRVYQFGGVRVSPLGEDCVKFQLAPDAFYNIKIVTTEKSVAMSINGNGKEATVKEFISGEYESFDTVIGVALDDKTSEYGFYHVVQVIYTGE